MEHEHADAAAAPELCHLLPPFAGLRLRYFGPPADRRYAWMQQKVRCTQPRVPTRNAAGHRMGCRFVEALGEQRGVEVEREAVAQGYTTAPLASRNAIPAMGAGASSSGPVTGGSELV